MHERQEKWQFIGQVLLPIVLIWLVAFCLGLPSPKIDDLFFIGAAINLTKKGVFINPWLADWTPIAQVRFFFQPPFYQMILSGWLNCFGITTASLLFFQNFCYATATISMALIFRHYRFPNVLSLLCAVNFAAFVFFSVCGLRGDALALALLALAIWCLTHDQPFRYFLGVCLAVTAVLCWPIVIAYALPLTLAVILANAYGKQPLSVTYVGSRVGACVLAVLIMSGIFLLAIDFKLTDFLHDMAWHSAFRVPPIYQAIQTFVLEITKYYGLVTLFPTYLLFAAMTMAVFLRKDFVPGKTQILLAVIAIGIILNIFVYSAIIQLSGFFAWLGILAAGLTIEKRREKIACLLVAAAVLALAHFPTALYIVFTDKTMSPEYRQQVEKIRTYVASHPDQKYAVDEVAARYVFDYKLPEKSVAWSFSAAAPALWPKSIAERAADTVWLVSADKVVLTPDLPVQMPHLKVCGHEFKSLPAKIFNEIIMYP